MSRDFFTEEFRAAVTRHNEYYRAEYHFPDAPPSVILRQHHEEHINRIREIAELWGASGRDVQEAIDRCVAELNKNMEQVVESLRTLGPAVQRAVASVQPFAEALARLHDALEEEPEKET